MAKAMNRSVSTARMLLHGPFIGAMVISSRLFSVSSSPHTAFRASRVPYLSVSHRRNSGASASPLPIVRLGSLRMSMNQPGACLYRSAAAAAISARRRLSSRSVVTDETPS